MKTTTAVSFLFLATWARTSTSSNVNFPPADPPPTPNFPRPQGCVAWVSHLGRRAPWIAAYLVARGHPSNPPADGIVSFFARNVPLALVFALPHSLLRPARLYRAPYIGRFGRLLYNILSAVTLHIFLLGFTPLSSPVVMVLPLPEKFHALLSVSCLFAAVSAFLVTPETWGLLGAGQLLGWSGRWRSNPERGMDAITWMGVTAWRAGDAVGGPITGALAFVAFTGISILPSELTLGDCLTRFIAAVYLRQRSRSFRVWVDSIEGAHLLGWGIRAGLLCAAVFDFAGTRRNTPATESNRLAVTHVSKTAALAGATALAVLLRAAESKRRTPMKASLNPTGNTLALDDLPSLSSRTKMNANMEASIDTPARSERLRRSSSGKTTPRHAVSCDASIAVAETAEASVVEVTFSDSHIKTGTF